MCKIYKKTAKESVKENQKENDLIIEGYTHEENMKNRVLFLRKEITQTVLGIGVFDFFFLGEGKVDSAGSQRVSTSESTDCWVPPI